MKYAYASRTGNVESIVNALGLDATVIESGSETMDDDFILFTYTDGFGDVPMEVESFLMTNGTKLKGVIVSGDLGYGDAYCKAGDKIRIWSRLFVQSRKCRNRRGYCGNK